MKTGAWNKYTLDRPQLERPQKDGPTEVAHYVETYDDGSRHVLCSRKNVVATPVAVWNVAHDVGRVPLCESCKDAIRTSFPPTPGYDANGRPIDACECGDHLPCRAIDWVARAGKKKAR